MPDASISRVEPRAPKKSQAITVIVTRSTEPMDFDAWADKYLRAVLALDAEQQRRLKDAA